jgi:hypothetical protein
MLIKIELGFMVGSYGGFTLMGMLTPSEFKAGAALRSVRIGRITTRILGNILNFLRDDPLAYKFSIYFADNLKANY